MLLKNLLSLPYLFCNAEFKFSWFHNTKLSSEIWILNVEMLLEFQNKTSIEIIEFQLMHFGFALELSDIDLWKTDFLDIHLDLLYSDISSGYFVCLHIAFKTS